MTTSDVQWRELAERLSQNEQRTQAIEALLLHDARTGGPLQERTSNSPVDTPRPFGKLRIPAPRNENVPAAVAASLAGAAHDLNNLLTLVTGHAELLREHILPESALRESVDLIVSSGHTAARVAQQLVAYSNPRADSIPGTLDPNAALRDSERMLVHLAGERIELDLILAPGIASIRADRTEFDRVVLNLVANARDAIEETGIVTVRTANATVSADRRGWPATCPPGEYVAVTVTDTGSGMTDDVKDRAFARFFTTKGARGTGLGLATVRDIVQAAGGHVELESSTEWGTSVRIFWPAVADHDEPISLSFEEAMIGASS